MPASLKIFDLPQAYRPRPGDPLQEFLKNNSGLPVAINATALRRFDTLVVQLLLVAARDWRRRGVGFTLTGLRPDLDDALRQIGVTDDLLDREAAA